MQSCVTILAQDNLGYVREILTSLEVVIKAEWNSSEYNMLPWSISYQHLLFF